MRLLFDENTPFSLARDLIGHRCDSVIRRQWRGMKNGALLKNAEAAGFGALITLDDDIEPEQNMAGRKISILVLKPSAQGKRATRALAGPVLRALHDLGPGEIRVVTAESDGRSEL